MNQGNNCAWLISLIHSTLKDIWCIYIYIFNTHTHIYIYTHSLETVFYRYLPSSSGWISELVPLLTSKKAGANARLWRREISDRVRVRRCESSSSDRRWHKVRQPLQIARWGGLPDKRSWSFIRPERFGRNRRNSGLRSTWTRHEVQLWRFAIHQRPQAAGDGSESLISAFPEDPSWVHQGSPQDGGCPYNGEGDCLMGNKGWCNHLGVHQQCSPQRSWLGSRRGCSTGSPGASHPATWMVFFRSTDARSGS